MKRFLLAMLLSAPALLPAHAQTAPDAQVRQVANFRGIRVGSGITLTVAASHTQRVEVSAATADFRDRIRATVTDDVLVLSYDDLLERDDRKLMRTDHKLRVAVTADFLTSLSAGSGSVVRAQGNFAAPDCQLDVSSGASLTATDLAPNVLVVREGSGATVTLVGTAPRLDIRTGSGATFDGQKLQSVKCQVEASSGSSVRIAVSEDLLAEASSGASIRYYGAPAVTKNVSSGGSVSGGK